LACWRHECDLDAREQHPALGTDTSRWYAAASVLSLGYVLVALAFGFWGSTGRFLGQRRTTGS